MSDDSKIEVSVQNTATNSAIDAADNFMRELIAFREMAVAMSVDESDMIKDWTAANREYISDEDWAEMPRLFDQFIEALKQAQAHMKAMQEGTTNNSLERPIYTASVPRESQAALAHLVFEIANRAKLDRLKLVGGAFLIAAISCFDVLFGNLIRAIYARNPTALSVSEHSFTLEELTQYTSIEEAQEALVTEKVETLLNESIDSRAKWLKSKANIDVATVTQEWPEIREVFARRNILVHADGRVNRRYVVALQSVSIDTSGLTLGEKLDLPISYLTHSLERLIAFGILLTFAIWTRLYKSDLDRAASWVISSQCFLVRHELWTATRLISIYLKPVRCRRGLSLTAQVNGWLANRALLGLASIEADVLDWDISGLSNQYALTRCLLLNDYEAAKPLIVNELRIGKLTRFEIATGALFDGFRQAYHIEDILEAGEDSPGS